MTSAFDLHIRLHRCDACGAPLEVPIEGGRIMCGYCHAPHTAERRPVHRTPSPRRATTEAAWAAGAEDPRSPFPPELMKAFRREARKRTTLEQSEAWWLEMRAALVPGHRASEAWAFGAAARLGTWYSAAHDHRRSRALFESLLDALHGEELRELVRLSIAREAARAGEIHHAEAWLAECDPAPDVLDVESQRRVTMAVIAQAREDWSGMLASLGTRGGEISFATWVVPLATVLRAHALERTGRAEQAYEEVWASQRSDAETMQILAYQASNHGIATATFKRFRHWRNRARRGVFLAIMLAILAAVAAASAWLRGS